MTKKRTYSDRKQYMINAVAKRRRKVKELAIESKGGKCEICGYNKCIGALELHHAFGSKSFSISEKGYTRSWEKVRSEIEKCVLLCANCHREVASGLITLKQK